MTDQPAPTLCPPNPFVETCARVGFVMRGVMYLVIALAAARAALGWARQPAGSTGAFAAILRQHRFGQAALALVAVGLAGFGVWCAARAFSRLPHATTRWKSLVSRADYFIGAAIHAALVVMCVQLLLGLRSDADVSGDESTRGLVATLLAYPLGWVIVTVIGAYVTINGLFQIHVGLTTNLDDLLATEHLTPGPRRAIFAVSRLGIAARGAVLAIFGLFIALAAWYTDAARAHGIGGTLQELAHRAGVGMLGLTAAGLIAYALYEFLRARYRRPQTM